MKKKHQFVYVKDKTKQERSNTNSLNTKQEIIDLLIKKALEQHRND